MKAFTTSTLAVLALTIGGFFGIGGGALGLIGLVGLVALLIDFGKTRQTQLEYHAFALPSLAVIALFVQGFFAVHEIAIGFTGLTGLLAVLIDMHLVRQGKIEAMQQYNLPVLAVVVMLFGGVFAVSELVVGYAGVIGLLALGFDFSRAKQKPALADLPSDQALVERDVAPA